MMQIRGMDVVTLKCPGCGAPASSDATRCEHCGARLATIACPSCFGMVFLGAQFCSHCGAKIERLVEEGAAKNCPRCKIAMTEVLIGTAKLQECGQCDGLWAGKDLFAQICEQREQQAAVLNMGRLSAAEQPKRLEQSIAYLPCPVCGDLMNRVNFAHCSGVVVDVCRQHGTWFDKDELRQIVEFIRAGGMEKSRQQQIDQLAKEKEDLQMAQIATPILTKEVQPMGDSPYMLDLIVDVVSSIWRHW